MAEGYINSNRLSRVLDKIGEVLFFILLTITPFVLYRYSKSAFRLPKQVFAQALIVLIIITWLIKKIEENDYRIFKAPLSLPILSLFLVSYLSMLKYPFNMLSIHSLTKVISYIFLYYIIVDTNWLREKVRFIINAVLFAAVLIATYSIFQYFKIDPFSLGRMYPLVGTIGNPNALSGYLILMIPVLLVQFFIQPSLRKKILLVLGLLILLFTLILTQTRSAWAGLAISIISLIILLKKFGEGESFRRTTRLLQRGVIIALVIFTLLSSFSPTKGFLINKINRITTLRNTSTAFRIMCWKITLNMIKDNPLIGMGLGTFQLHYLDYQAKFLSDKRNLRYLRSASNAKQAHNEYLQIASEIGIIGLALFIWLIGAFFIKSIRIIRREEDKEKKFVLLGLLATIPALLGHALFSFPFHIVPTSITSLMFMGLILREDKPRNYFNLLSEFKLPSSTKRIMQIIVLFAGLLLLYHSFDPLRANIYWFKGIQWTNVNKIWYRAIREYIKEGEPAGKLFKGEKLMYERIKRMEKEGKDIEKFFAEGKWKLALENYQKALNFNPTQGSIHFYMAIAYTHLGYPNLALDEYRISQQTFNDASIYFNRGGIFFQKGLKEIERKNVRKARAYLLKSVEELKKSSLRKPDHADTYINLGNAYYYLGDFTNAERVYRKALRIKPRIIRVYLNLAMLYHAQGYVERATSYWKEVLKIDPDNKEAKILLSEYSK